MFTSTLELAVFRNRLRLTDLESGRTLERAATYPFSTSRMLIADRECLEQEFKTLARQLTPQRRLFFLPIFIPPHIRVVLPEGDLEPVERDALRQALIDAGASKVTLPGG